MQNRIIESAEAYKKKIRTRSSKGELNEVIYRGMALECISIIPEELKILFFPSFFHSLQMVNQTPRRYG